VPYAAISYTLCPAFTLGHDLALAIALFASFWSFPFDYVVRQKTSQPSLPQFVVEQTPAVPPSRYSTELLDFVVPRVVELTYTAWDIQSFAQDVLDEVGADKWAIWFADRPVHLSPPPLGQPGKPAPFVWDEEHRAKLRAELDALYAHLYGLTRDELDYILDTFPIVRRKDEEKYGEYRTKRMVLEEYEKLEGRFTNQAAVSRTRGQPAW
jgi:hypothetical protein